MYYFHYCYVGNHNVLFTGNKNFLFRRNQNLVLFLLFTQVVITTRWTDIQIYEKELKNNVS